MNIPGIANSSQLVQVENITVSAILSLPDDAFSLLVFAHGAGAGMRHPFMEDMSTALARRSVATLRYNFPYMEKGVKRPDPAPVLVATVRAVVEKGHELLPDLPLFVGGKSMGGRMTSNAQAETPMEGVRGIVFFGFPLHPPGQPSTDRADHLRSVDVPMLFLQGTRDEFADLSLLCPVCASLGARATLHLIDGADHSFQVLKRSGKTDAGLIEGMAGTVCEWCRGNAGWLEI